MKDFLKQDLNTGDYCVILDHSRTSSSLKVGKIVRFTAKTVFLVAESRWGGGRWSDEKRCSSKLVKMSEDQCYNYFGAEEWKKMEVKRLQEEDR